MARHGHVSLKTHRTAKSDRNRAILSAPAGPLDPLAVSASGSPHRPTAQRVRAPARLRRPAADIFARQPPSLVHPHGDGLTTSHPKHQARPTVADTGTACTPSATTFSTREATSAAPLRSARPEFRRSTSARSPPASPNQQGEFRADPSALAARRLRATPRSRAGVAAAPRAARASGRTGARPEIARPAATRCTHPLTR